MRNALITGITGQDGGYLSKLLLDNGYRAFGLDRRTSTSTTERLQYLSFDPEITRPADVPALCGNAAKVRAELGWQPTTTLEELIAMMVEADLKRVGDERW